MSGRGRGGPGEAPDLARILGFLADIGLPGKATASTGATMLPAVTVANGTLFYDRAEEMATLA